MSHRPASDFPFFAAASILTGLYALLVVGMLLANAAFLLQAGGGESAMLHTLADPNIQAAIKLSLLSTAVTTLLSLCVAIPAGYLLSRCQFRGRQLLETVLDVPFVLPPLVVGISLLILFQYLPATLHDAVVYQAPAVVLAQFVVACALAIRVMRATFDQMGTGLEQVALTLGASRWQAFASVVLPQARPGVLAAGTLAWARALGEFGPLLVFAGVTRGKTEVLSTSVYLELSVGNLEGAVAVSFLMIAAAAAVLLTTRRWGRQHLGL